MKEGSLTNALEGLRVALSSNAPVAELDSAIARVASFRDTASVGPLLCLLDDDADYDEPMFSLIHAAEDFDDATYARGVLGVISEISRSAPKWSSIVLMRILNNRTAKLALVDAMRTAGAEEKSAIRSLCEAINTRSTEFMAKTMPLLLAAKE